VQESQRAQSNLSGKVFFRAFCFANTELVSSHSGSTNYFRVQLSDYFSQMCITKVTFTHIGGRATIQSWFGSSGGGLPRRPELKSLGRFLFALREKRFDPGGRGWALL
jgi:hypothetical protein